MMIIIFKHQEFKLIYNPLTSPSFPQILLKQSHHFPWLQQPLYAKIFQISKVSSLLPALYRSKCKMPSLSFFFLASPGGLQKLNCPTRDQTYSPFSEEWSPNQCIELVEVTQLQSTLQPHGWQPIRLLCLRNPPGKNTGVGCSSLLEIFLTQVLSPGLLH